VNRWQRVIVVVYCLMLTGCFLWLPWCVSQQQDYVRLGNAWLWSGPYEVKWFYSCESNLVARWDIAANDWICDDVVEPKSTGHALLSDIDEKATASLKGTANLETPPKVKAKHIGYKKYLPYAQPDNRLILLRLLAATTICAALFVTAGLWRRGLIS